METLTKQLKELIAKNVKDQTRDFAKENHYLKVKIEHLTKAIKTICKDYNIENDIIEKFNALQKEYDESMNFWGSVSTSLFCQHIDYERIVKILKEEKEGE